MTHARRSRRGWPDREEPDSLSAPATSDAALASLKRAVMALIVFVLMLAVAVGGLLYYVFGRTQFRDAQHKAEQAQQRAAEQQFREGICAILDGLPAGALLQPARDKYDCGPGVPVDQLSPEVLGNLQQFGTVIPEPAQPLPRVKPEPGTASQPAVPSQEPPAQPAPATSTPAPSAEPTAGLPVVPDPVPAAPTTPPLVDLTPITDQLCDALGVCL